MERTLFYSWESDLPKSNNLNFIERCIKDALKEIKKMKPIGIDIRFDKATRNITGTPDIAETIFQKINRCSVFVADISIINSKDPDSRKTPNPNVLLELGYAARVIGWERIICIYNTKYGDLIDLPFDLRNRRIMFYSLKDDDKINVRKKLTSEIRNAIKEMIYKGIIDDKIFLFLKEKIDQEILGLISHFIRFIKMNSKKPNFFKEVQDFLNIDKKNLNKLLKDKKILGFYLLKSFDEYEENFRKIISEALCSPYYKREILHAIIDIYEWFPIYAKFWTEYSSKFFIKLKEKEKDLFVIHGSKISQDNKMDRRYLLMKRIDKEKAIVLNFGDFPLGIIPNLTNYYKLNPDYLEKYVDTILYLINKINKWLDLTNNEILMDFIKQFRIKKANGKWL